MGAGPNWATVKSYKYRKLKAIESALKSADVPCKYANLEVAGANFVVYFAGVGPASNGEYFSWKVLRFNPESKPSAVKKSAGDVDYSDFHTRDIPEFSEGCFESGVQKILALAA